MRPKPDWKHAQPGVMLYVPAPRISVKETEQSLSQLSVTDDKSPGARSQISRISDTVVPSCEDVLDVSIKSEPLEIPSFDFARVDSPDTLAGNTDGGFLLDAVSVASLTPDSSASSDILAQLMAAADSASAEATRPCAQPLSNQSFPAPTEDSVDINYDSERTDFLEHTPSPSLRKPKNVPKRITGVTSRHFQRTTKSKTNQSPIRRLNFETRTNKQPVKDIKRSVNALALENLRSIERAPSHNWDEDERELLCVLNRWYCATDRATELTVFANIFNSITGLEIKPIRVRNQFHCHLRLYGGDAYREYARVFSVPFDDPEGCYTEIRALIEQEAEALCLDLQKRQFDVKVPSGRAKFAKSPTTRSIYKSLVRKASQETKCETTQESVTEDVPVLTRSIAITTMAMKVPFEDDWEIVTDAETSPKPRVNTLEVPKSTSTRPHLAFRVWDTASRTNFVDGSFVAQAFVDWPRPFPAPIALDDPSNAGKILTVLHLSKHGDTPVYISTASSLLQVLSYATNMQQPRIALIDLDAPCLQKEQKVHHAADVFPWLKSQGLARWARYKGNGEYFVWSDIPSDAVLHIMDLTDLIKNLNNDTDCHELLSFDIFEPGTKTDAIASALREKNVTLNTAIACALGKTARMFGMNQSNVTLEHLQNFVARLMDGWTIVKADTLDIHTMSSLAATFATALGPHAAGHTLQGVMGAFLSGVDDGTRCIAHWSRSRSGSRRQRFRSA